MRRSIRNFNIPPPGHLNFCRLNRSNSRPPGQNYVQMPYPSAKFVCQMPLPKNKPFWWVVELLCCSWNLKSLASILPRFSWCDNLLSPGCKTREVIGYKCYLQIYLLFDEGCCSLYSTMFFFSFAVQSNLHLGQQRMKHAVKSKIVNIKHTLVFIHALKNTTDLSKSFFVNNSLTKARSLLLYCSIRANACAGRRTKKIHFEPTLPFQFPHPLRKRSNCPSPGRP